MNVLVTGGAGFVGSHLVDRLPDEGHAVTSVDNLDAFYDPAFKEANVAAHLRNPNFRLVRTDICDLQTLRNELDDNYHVIVHLAAKAGVLPSLKDPIAYQRVNIAGTQNLLEFARDRSVPQFVFASSSSVYGINNRLPWREDDGSLQPISPYAATKISGELLGHVYSQLFGMRFIALRLFTVYGPRQRPDLAIRKFAGEILAGRPVTVFGDGSTSRDYTYVDDIVRGIQAAIEYHDSDYEVINLGQNHPVTLKDLIQKLEVVLERKAIIEPKLAQPGDVPNTWGDISKAGRLLDYRPQVALPDGLRLFADWFVSKSGGQKPSVNTAILSAHEDSL
jgi:UDP-glucuronate 4-epimerase